MCEDELIDSCECIYNNHRILIQSYRRYSNGILIKEYQRVSMYDLKTNALIDVYEC